MKISVTFLCVFIVASVHAQRTYDLGPKGNSGERYILTVDSEDPEELSKLMVGIDLFTSMPSFSMGPGLFAEYHATQKFYLTASAALPFDLLASGKSVNKDDFEKFAPYSQIAFNGTYFLTNKHKQKTKSLYFGTKPGRTENVSLFARLKVPKSIKYGRRAGGQYNSLPIRMMDDTRDYSKSQFPQVLKATSFTAGLGRTATWQYQASTKEFGKQGGQRITHFYLDAIILLSGNTYHQPEGSTNPADFVQVKSKSGEVGWKFGLTSLGSPSPQGFGFKCGFEFGTIPSMIKGKGHGGYFNFQLGFVFGK